MKRALTALSAAVALLVITLFGQAPAQAFCGSLCGPGAAPILAESSGVAASEGGLLAGAGGIGTAATETSIAAAGAAGGGAGVAPIGAVSAAAGSGVSLSSVLGIAGTGTGAVLAGGLTNWALRVDDVSQLPEGTVAPGGGGGVASYAARRTGWTVTGDLGKDTSETRTITIRGPYDPVQTYNVTVYDEYPIEIFSSPNTTCSGGTCPWGMTVRTITIPPVAGSHRISQVVANDGYGNILNASETWTPDGIGSPYIKPGISVVSGTLGESSLWAFGYAGKDFWGELSVSFFDAVGNRIGGYGGGNASQPVSVGTYNAAGVRAVLRGANGHYPSDPQFQVIYQAGTVGYIGPDLVPDPAPPTSPQRWIQRTVTCKRADGSSVSYSADSPQTAFANGQVIELAGLMCPAGEKLGGWNTVVKTLGGPDTNVSHGTVPDSILNAMPNACFNAGSMCILDLQAKVGTDWRTCFGPAVDCTNWWTQSPPLHEYRCVYGSAVIGWTATPLRQCRQYDSMLTPTPTKVIVYPPQPPVVPDPDPGGSSSLCDIGFADVLSGVVMFKAVGCAIEWAFVPDAETMQVLTGELKARLEDSALGGVGDLIGGVFGPASSDPTNGDCHGPHVVVPQAHVDAYPFQACTAPQTTFAAASRMVLSITFLGGAALLAARTVGRSFGLDVPDGSKGD